MIELMYPLAGNEAAIGLDLSSHPAQRGAALTAIESGSMVLAGPVDLVQGGRGFIGRFPVFVKDGSAIEPIWGLVSAVVDVDRLYRDSGLLRDDLPIHIALTGRDADLSDNAPFFGDAGILDQEPVTAQVSLPTGGWRIAAIPREGWKQTPPNALELRSFIALAALMVILPIGVAGYFYDQHRGHIRKLEEARLQMEHNSLHDSLTGLPNRRFLDQRILSETAATRPASSRC
ncbi:MAG: CHASE domain-containing protein [Pseudomonadota bacterium]